MLDAVRLLRSSSSYRSIDLSAADARPQQQTHQPPLLLSIDGTRTDGRTLDRFMTLTAYYADRVP